MSSVTPQRLSGANVADLVWPIPMREINRLARTHEPAASQSPPGFRLATCVLCERPMVAMWHLWMDWVEVEVPRMVERHLIKEIHMCHACATDWYGAPTPDGWGLQRMTDAR